VVQARSAATAAGLVRLPVDMLGTSYMTRLKLTSPGVLLILAVLAAGGIFLLDLFILQPHIEAQKWSALREEAARTEHAVQLAFQAEESSLLRAAAAWAGGPRIAGLLKDANVDEIHGHVAQVMAPAQLDRVWIADVDGTVMRQWSAPKTAAAARGEPAHGTGEESTPDGKTDSVAQRLCAAAGTLDSGLIREGTSIYLFARHKLPVGEEADGRGGQLYMARRLGAKLLAKLGSAAGGPLVLVSADRLPRGIGDDGVAPQTMWLTARDQMTVAWLCPSAKGRTLGYYLATVSVAHIHRQAVTSRRMVLIILSLSVGLALLVILGTHMLITGPVVRLLGRLQQLESGEGSPQDLAHNLHGEPLMLARRLENAFQKLAHISKTDELTGLANRRHFEQVLEAFYHQARRYNRPLSVVVMDVDFFKAVNDAGGHQAGDGVLKLVASAVEEACRKADLPARFGGDEFAVLLPETAAGAAEAVAERIRRAVSEHTMSVRNVEMNITASIGIADLNAGEMDGPGAMMGLADRALYAAKQRGRNRVVQAHDLHLSDLKDVQKENGRIDVLTKTLAGLDNRFKDLFLLAFDEVMALLQQRDPHMADHTRKVQHYATLIAREMELPERVLKRIDVAAMMHDIGMVAMPDAILLCPTELDEEQTLIMRRHPLLSVRIMDRMEFLEQEIPAVRYHHERYDGRGYPEGIAGASIPLTARILAVADAFDAMTSPRAFRDAKSCAEALGEIHRSAGEQFDPTVVDAFMSVADRLGAELMHIPGVGKETDTSAPRSPHSTAAWRETGGEPKPAASEPPAEQ